MSITRRLAPTVAASIQARGRELYRLGAVYIYRGNDLEVEASVMGSRLYPVSANRADQLLNVVCACPYFAGGSGVCKHIWAMLLAVDAAGYLDARTAVEYDDDSDLDLPLSDEDLARAMEQFTRTGELDGGDDTWMLQLRAIEAAHRRQAVPRPGKPRELLYLVDAAQTRSSEELAMDVVTRQLKRDGGWTKPKSLSISAASISALTDPSDRQILSMVLGICDPWASSYGYYGYSRDRSIRGSGLRIPDSILDAVLPLVCRTGRGRLLLGASDAEGVPLALDEGPPWELWLDLQPAATEDSFRMTAGLRRAGATMSLDEPALLLASGFVVTPDGAVARLEDFKSFDWISQLRRHPMVEVPAARVDEFLGRLAKMPNVPRLKVPAQLEYAEVLGTPAPRLQIRPNQSHWNRRQNLDAILSFDYDGDVASPSDPVRGFMKTDPRQLVLRDKTAEKAALETLRGLGVGPDAQGDLKVTVKAMPGAVRSLTRLGWTVEAEGSLYRTAGPSRVNLNSGIDWFELDGTMEFGDQTASFPDLLAAVRRGDDFVRLGDGTIGLVPEDWIQRYSAVASLGSLEEGRLRFKHTQAGLLDTLLATQPEVRVDELFAQVRDRLRAFEGVAPIAEPESFQGELRTYQREGLGWFGFLREFGFGGCLADDMGLGKTVQVLALLEARRTMKQAGTLPSAPSLIVVPKSLIFNWMAEIQRFTPRITVLDHTGGRQAPGDHFGDYDVVLTTYGTLRRDAAHFTEVRFDYAILDEAQAIKNSATASAKAARLLQADHRLALSGTPIENHLGELWSLFEFLNPGMLGAARAFAAVVAHRNPDRLDQQSLAQALRPFILRRTKEQVAADLPQKTEQTQFCELGAPQRKQYDQLRNHFRQDLLKRVDREGMARSKMFVLEALLRLRQAACHPGLIDPKRAGEMSAKLEVLLPQLVEVADEGHKAIVFSQFTRMLGILKPKLDELGIVYEYLDGNTRDRQAAVERFQTDPDCQLFLISLKAGGLGLNLTAAEYVFLLDPWWNPAVEAQAIDRAHRIGQTRPVFAYRIIARNTVEEKVLQVQDSKRALADAIIGADNSLIRQIGRDDLELLLS